jgi:hypothetical protein
MPAPCARWIRRNASALAVAALVVGVAVAGPVAVPSAQAADLAQFDPGLIMSDSIFYDSSTMNAYGIQLFLNSKGAGCHPNADGTPCLKDYRQDTASRVATARCPGGYAGAPGESAALIISKVSRACGINPQVIITMLQKEEGLVTATGSSLTASRYRSAMGYGCPDTSVCDSLYYGFFNQVYSAASQFRNYALNPTWYSHMAGVTNNIGYSPNGACGASPVFIQNQATAGLYNYTPYQPNAAALAAGYGYGDACSAYGNRNFWNYFTDWFGPTTQRPPFGVIDAISATPSSITIGGWALDPDTTDAISVHVYLDGGWLLGAAAAGLRPDVGAAYGKGDLHGYNVTFAATTGAHQVCVYAIDATGGANPQIGCRSITVVNRPPVGVIDSISTTGTQLTVSGWAFDPDTTGPIGVHFYIDGGWSGATTASAPRADVGAAYGDGPNHGYSASLSSTVGTHTLCAFGIDANGGPNPAVACRTFTIAAPQPQVNHLPVGVIDSVSSTGTDVTISGWAFDPDTTQSIGVHFYVDGRWAGATAATAPRADVGAVYGLGDNHGYSATLTVGAGAHTVCAYGIDSAGGPNPAIACRTFTVTAPVNRPPVGVIDSVVVSGATATVAGWTFDPDTKDPINVQFSIDGGTPVTTIAESPRPDVDSIYGAGPTHGYSATLAVSAGNHTICAAGIDASGGPSPTFACRSFTAS